MRTLFVLVIAAALLFSSAVFAEEAKKEAPKPGKYLCEAYPNLVNFGLKYAKLAQLPEGVIVQGPGVSFKESQLPGVFNANPAVARLIGPDQMYFLEMSVTAVLLAGEGARELKISQDQDTANIYLYRLLDKMALKVTDEEAAKYVKDKNLPADTDLKAIKKALLARKKMVAENTIYRELGKRSEILISEAWVKKTLAEKKPDVLDEVRKSGKPGIVFSLNAANEAEWKKLEPEFDKVLAEYKGKIETAYIFINQFPNVAFRCQIESYSEGGFTFFNKKGEMTATFNEFMTVEQFKAEIEKIVK